jgi:NAD+ diphosphatase
MLTTPPNFTPLLSTPHHDTALSFVFCGDQLLLCDEDSSLPAGMALQLLGLRDKDFHPLGLWDSQLCRATWIAPNDELPKGYSVRKLRSLFSELPAEFIAIAGRAYQIAEWARTHRFCGACGTKTVFLDGDRSAKCPACGHSAYPRISPAMMVLVKNGDKILLARHAGPRAVFATALAGFLEAGESIEEAVHREVLEEVGLRVKNLRYFGSQSWPFPHSLMVAFTAEYDSGEIVVDPVEIAEARWYGPADEAPETPGAGYSIAGQLIQAHWPWRKA